MTVFSQERKAERYSIKMFILTSFEKSKRQWQKFTMHAFGLQY
jgi:hypothetical protein